MNKAKELIVRSLSGTLFVVVIMTAIFSSPFALSAVFAIVVALVASEYLTLTLGKGERRALKIITVASCVLLFLLWCPYLLFGYSHPAPIMAGLFLMMFAGVMAIYVTSLLSNNYKGIENALASFVYVAFPFSTVPMLVFVFKESGLALSGEWGLASVLIILWASDIGAYCIGSLFGQGEKGHKLCPAISPKKSWEGVFGGILFAIAVACVLNCCGVLMPKGVVGLCMAVVFALSIAIAGVVGDLVESQLKRHCGVKDSGNWIPGHGGFLDRFDSALFAFPVALVVYSIMVIIYF